MLLFCEEYRMFCEIIHKEGKIQLNINGIRQLIRLLARERNMNQLKNGIIVKTYLSGK